MKNNKKPFEYADDGNLQWLTGKEGFVEFVWILVHFRNSVYGRNDLANRREEFNRQADLLGESLLRVFKPDIWPYETFHGLRIRTNPSFEFTAMTAWLIRRMLKDELFHRAMTAQGLLPSYETMRRVIQRRQKAEQLTCLLFPYLRMD